MSILFKIIFSLECFIRSENVSRLKTRGWGWSLVHLTTSFVTKSHNFFVHHSHAVMSTPGHELRRRKKKYKNYKVLRCFSQPSPDSLFILCAPIVTVVITAWWFRCVIAVTVGEGESFFSPLTDINFLLSFVLCPGTWRKTPSVRWRPASSPLSRISSHCEYSFSFPALVLNYMIVESHCLFHFLLA